MGPTEITPSMPVSDSDVIVDCVSARQAQENRAKSTKIIRRRCCSFINDNSAFGRCFRLLSSATSKQFGPALKERKANRLLAAPGKSPHIPTHASPQKAV